MITLVTGCAGFIGSNLTERLLSEGTKVIGIDCFTKYYDKKIKYENIKNFIKNPEFTLIQKDILEMDCYPDVDVVFHQAAQAGVRSSWGSDFSIYTRNNIEATQKLLEWYKDKNLIKFVYASSSSVYGDVPLPMNEEMKLQPVSPYGVTKLAGEHLCYLYYKNFEIPSISLRYFTVYGPRQRPDMAIYKFVKAIMNNAPISLYGDGNQTRDFTYISDIVEANILAMKSAKDGLCFNVGGGSRIAINDLIHIIEGSCNRKALIQYETYQKGDVNNTLAEIKRAEIDLKWHPNVTIQEGIQRYVEWIIQNSSL